jgi:hypothetical protein
VFVRELISNASDALEKLRYLRLTGEASEGSDARPLEIHIATDKQKRTLTIQVSYEFIITPGVTGVFMQLVAALLSWPVLNHVATRITDSALLRLALLSGRTECVIGSVFWLLIKIRVKQNILRDFKKKFW